MREFWNCLAVAMLAFVIGAAGCGVDEEVASSDVDADSDADGDAGADSGSDADTDTDADTDSDADGDCSEDSKFVYVVDSNAMFWRFDPETPDDHPFTFIATLACPSGGSPFSMAIDRNDRAYVLYYSGGLDGCIGLNEVNIHTGECVGLTEFECGQYDFNTFGMGFATDGPDTTDETLYVGKASFDTNGDSVGAQLAWIDTSTWELSPIGPLSDSPELTGNQNGELWAYYAWAEEPRVVQLDKGTGFESNQFYLPEDMGGVSAFAFAFWGGDFYLFHAPENSSTTVYRLHDGVFEEWVSTTGMQVVGAGVSTCAPVIVD